MALITADAVHLRASGVSLVIAAGDGRLPRIAYWGAELGEDDAPELGDDGSAEGRAVALLPERSRGWFGTPGIAGHRGGRDHAARFVTTAVDLESEGDGPRHVQRLSVLAADRAADLALTVVIEMLASGLVRTRATLESTGHGSAGHGSAQADDGEGAGQVAPFALDSMTLALPVPARATELAPFPGRDDRLPFGRGTHARESRTGTPGRDGSALLAAGTDGFGYRSGEAWVTHVAWSGNVRHLAERADVGARASGAGQAGVKAVGGGELLLPGEISLEPGESYASPWVYFSYGSGLDEASSRFHRFLRARPDHPSKPRPVVATTTGVDFDIARLTALADASAAVGAELFVLGDGWFKGGALGDWYVDKAVFPEGLRPFADYVRGLGLEFGMWFAPEAVGEASDLAREHPEWVAGRALDLANPDALAHIEERLHALIEELRPAHVVCDRPRDVADAGSGAAGHAPGHAQTLAFYGLLDGLRAAFPGLEIEVRSDGGGRSDLEVLLRAHRARASRCADSFDSAEATGLVVPPELTALDLPARSRDAGRGTSGDRAREAFWGHLGFEWSIDDPVPPPERLAELRAWIQLHKRYRALLHSSQVVRSDAPGRVLGLRGVVSGNRREALYACSLAEAAPDAAPLIHLDALDPGRAYRVTVVRDPLAPEDPGHDDAAPGQAAPEDSDRPAAGWWEDGVIVSGRMLAAHGIQVPPRGPSGVVLLRVERAKAAPHRF